MKLIQFGPIMPPDLILLLRHPQYLFIAGGISLMLLVELFRIHQRHWDEIRRREIPSFEQFRADIAKLVEAARTFQGQAAALLGVLQSQPPAHRAARITRAAAIFATIAGLLAGYLIGRTLP